MSAHIHAESMKQYAEDAMTTDKPWELWEFKANLEEEWTEPLYNLRWQPFLQYRRKPQTININGFEVPEPYRGEMERGQKYYYPLVGVFNRASYMIWEGDETDSRYMSRGLIHLTRKDATLHSKALASFTSRDTNT